MPSYNQEVLGLAAFCSFNADAAAAAFFLNRGFAGFVRNGVGDYSLTMANPVNTNTNGLVRATVQNGAAVILAVEVVSTTVLRVRTITDAAAAVDADFWLEVLEVAPA